MKVEIKPATLRDISYCAVNAREADRREIYLSGPRSPAEAAVVTWFCTENVGGAAWCAHLDGNPEVAFGFVRQSEMTPWLFSAWMWGTDKTKLCLPAISRWAFLEKNWHFEAFSRGATRIEVRSHASHIEAHRWLNWTGARLESSLVDWGRDRERFVQFAWVAADFEGERADVLLKIGTSATGGSEAADHKRG